MKWVCGAILDENYQKSGSGRKHILKPLLVQCRPAIAATPRSRKRGFADRVVANIAHGAKEVQTELA